VLNGELNQVPYQVDPWFGFEVPKHCPDVPSEILNPAALWSDKTAYQNSIQQLVAQFNNNIKRYQDSTPEEVLSGGPLSFSEKNGDK
jgi:phosphoenolpyruvate carboxykinase (ATP)